MDAAAQSDYVDARMTLRPARVAVVFDGGDDWHYWARLAIYAASQVWGGAGFILIPHRDGEVAPSLLQAASAYDPDHVVLLRVTVRHFELARPGVQPLRLNGQLVTGAAREELVEKAGAAVIDDASGEKARQAVAAVCSPYRHQIESGEWTDELTALNADRTGGDLTPISGLEGVPGGSRLAAPADWGGSLGVAVAARCGALVEPVPAGPPKMDDEERLDLIRWLLSDGERGTPPYSAVWHPAAAVSVLPLGLETAFDWGRQGLTVIQRGFAPRRPALLVAGDEAADFALALAWDRLYGRSLWLPSDWQPRPGRQHQRDDGHPAGTRRLRLRPRAPGREGPAHHDITRPRGDDEAGRGAELPADPQCRPGRTSRPASRWRSRASTGMGSGCWPSRASSITSSPSPPGRTTAGS